MTWEAGRWRRLAIAHPLLCDQHWISGTRRTMKCPPLTSILPALLILHLHFYRVGIAPALLRAAQSFGPFLGRRVLPLSPEPVSQRMGRAVVSPVRALQGRTELAASMRSLLSSKPGQHPTPQTLSSPKWVLQSRIFPAYPSAPGTFSKEPCPLCPF